MKLTEKYCEAFEDLERLTNTRRSDRRYPALGYTSNLDYLCNFDIAVLNELLQEHLSEMLPDEMKAFHIIHSLPELLQTIVFYCLNGIGGEAEFEDIDMLGSIFEWTNGMGGTGVQAAMALAAVECPSVVHLTDDSREVCKILASPYIYTVSEAGELIHTGSVTTTREQEIHCIIQFKKGDQIYFGDQGIPIPVSNRLILTKMTVNTTVPLFDPYFKYIEQNAQQFSSNVLSSFNEISDPELLQKHMTYIGTHIKEYRRCNETGVVFFEDAHYHSGEIHRLCMEMLYPVVDIVSLNEEELEYTLKMYDYQVDLDDIVSCVEGMKYIRNRFGIRRGVIVHTRDYAMYVGDEADVDIESGLIYGNLLATAKAIHGWYGAKEQIKTVVELDLSKIGQKKRERLLASGYSEEAVLVPSKYVDKPRYTIGLGDSFVAGVQMCF